MQISEQLEFIRQVATFSGDTRLEKALELIASFPEGSEEQVKIIEEVYTETYSAMQKFLETGQPPETEWELTVLPEAPQAEDQYDVIIVGSGVGGMTVGVELAQAGAKVLMLEGHSVYGGATHTYNRKGKYIIEAGVESVSGLGPLGAVNHFLTRHDLWKELEFLKTEFHFSYGGHYWELPNTLEGWVDSLCSRYPQEAEGIRGFFDFAEKAYVEKYSFFESDRLTPRMPTEEEVMSYAQIHPHNYHLMNTTWGEFMDEYLKDPMLKKEVSMLSHFIGDANENTPTSDMLPLLGYFIIGGFRIKGGSSQLANAFITKFQEYGGKIMVNTSVKKFLVEDGKIAGVETSKGNFYAPIVVSNADTRMTFESLLGLEHLSEEYQELVKGLKPSASAYIFQGFMKKPFPHKAMVTYYFKEPKELKEYGLTFVRCAYFSSPAHDPSLFPEGEGGITLNLVAKADLDYYNNMSPEEYAKLKEKLGELFMEIVREIDAETADNMVSYEISTPKSASRYIRTYQGSVYGTKPDRKNEFPKTKTPMPGLFICGAGHLGAGVEAVLISGGFAADAIKPHFEARQAAAVK
ncbi:NAD(P)/FAD-dependent oxidoreductase [Tumebacillus sp. ITR2]|uniref:NAD(P)/FAD-dependent oxidoreductase n=1 Tax=Tumebacillus amylolyticus TaxID=2801339 RepID=A0ABS1JA65_9BACL|nr:NAD(P)/FAD-dependent oxidoreductase [Tumebacillus amylolyticus]MBL0387167.1 NAD(P)/FAD-dependent oxidoreductase [Tumebacillus amylolyticus]